ncbi:G-protein coupled receptor 55-like [Chelonia mydas]|uniref:G-protein coupled receptor 55-like n=1 Tax=Chelonia mydas TaxID=8469 RepID=UPI0018A2356A|nr:G-protein coupled receptor 55-like [Chelonia mydas]
MANSSIESYVQLFQITVYIPTFVLGLLFNAMALWFAFCKIRKLTESIIYLVSLITLDTLLLFTLPFKIISYGSQKKWNVGSAFCSFLESLYFANMYGSILISACICVDRYIAIRHPLLAISLRSTRKAAMVCSIVCVGVWAGTYQFYDNTPTACFNGFSNKTWGNPAVLVTLETAFSGSLIAMIFCTVQIIICLKRSRRPDDPLTDTSKSVKIVMANLATFVVCFTPFHVMLFLYYLVKKEVIKNSLQQIILSFVQISLCWANLNCCLDAICYYFVLKEFLKSPRQGSQKTSSVS